MMLTQEQWRVLKEWIECKIDLEVEKAKPDSNYDHEANLEFFALKEVEKAIVGDN